MAQNVGSTGLAYARVWHSVNAEGRSLGKLASRISQVLCGKHKPIFDGSADCGDYVTVMNCEKVTVGGKNATQKAYWKQSTYPGRSRQLFYHDKMKTDPAFILRMAVSRMLPKNGLRKDRLARLKIVPGPIDPYIINSVKRYDLGDALPAPRTPATTLANPIPQSQAPPYPSLVGISNELALGAKAAAAGTGGRSGIRPRGIKAWEHERLKAEKAKEIYDARGEVPEEKYSTGISNDLKFLGSKVMPKGLSGRTHELGARDWLREEEKIREKVKGAERELGRWGHTLPGGTRRFF